MTDASDRSVRPNRSSVRSTRGFTLIELLMAVLLFVVGIAAMARTAPAVMAMLTGSKTRTIGAAVAQSRFERIQATACASRANGSATTRGVTETWTVTHLAHADDVSVTITFPTEHRTKSQTYKGYLPC
jgi:prepilin-type N-terminal cleavage/methylation domain-containing protein